MKGKFLKKSFKKKFFKKHPKKTVQKLATRFYENALNDSPLVRLNTGKEIVHKFKRTAISQANLTVFNGSVFAENTQFPTYPSSGVTSESAYIGFSLLDIPNLSDFYNLYQKIRLRKVKLTARMNDTYAGSSLQASIYMGKYLGYTKPTTITTNTIGCLQNAIKYQFSNEHRECSLTILPQMVQPVVVANNGPGTAQTNWQLLVPRKQWLDLQEIRQSTYSAVYTGILAYIDNLGSNAGDNLVWDIEYSFECKDPVVA